MVEHDTLGHAQPPPPLTAREREVNLCRQDIGELVERERRVVREDADPIGPQPDRDEILVLSGGEVDEAIDAPADTTGTTAVEVVKEKLRRVAGVRGLSCREESLLARGELEKAVPVGAVLELCVHAQNVS